MENQIPPIPTVPVVDGQQTITPEQPKQNNLLTILLSVLLFVSLAVTGFLLFQTQKLSKELTAFKNISPTPITSTEPTFEPGLEPEPIPSEILTKDWKIFTHTFGYSLKYPNNINLLAMKNFPEEDTTSTNQYPDIILTFAESGFDKPHLRILRIAKNYPDNNLTLIQIANRNYQANLNTPASPAIAIQAPSEGTFLETPSVNYVLKNQGFISISDEYSGYDGEYHVVWVEKNGYKYMIYWTDESTINQILSTFKFTN